MKRHVLALLSLLSLGTLATAQQQPVLCGTDLERARLIAEDPTYLEREAALAQEIHQLMLNSRVDRGGGEPTYMIPVVFHVLHLRGRENISNEQLLNAMDILNRDYEKQNADTSEVWPVFRPIIADMDIEFRLANRDPTGNCTTGIIRHQTIETFRGESTSKLRPWPREKYMNVWVTDRILSGAAGYYTPGGWSVLDGIMILNDYTGSIGTSNENSSRALTHEVGHYLNLSHVWGSNNGVPEGAPPGHMTAECGDDGVEDTPLTRGWNFCANEAASKNCDPNIAENVQNYMEYSYCSVMFTEGQRERARAALNAVGLQRNNLWTEENLQETGVAIGSEIYCAPDADFYAQPGLNWPNVEVPFPPLACTNIPIHFMDNSVRAFPTSWSWTFQDGTPSTSTQQNPTVQFSSSGWKTVTLTATNAYGSTTKTDPYAVYIGAADVSATPYFESFETMTGTDLYPYLSMNYDNSVTAFQRFTGGGFTGNACAKLNAADQNPLDIIDPVNVGDYDELVTPLFNLSGAPSATFSFRYAYYTTATDIDTVDEYLEITSSTDCGRSWLLRGRLEGTALITNGNNTSEPPSEWKLKTYSLPGSLLAPNVRFRFRYVSSGFSGNLYIDDIWAGVPVGVEEFMTDGFISVYPNPSNDRFTLQVIGMDAHATEITVTDLRGAVVHQGKYQPLGGDANIEISGREIGLSEGMYMVRASNKLGSSVQKLIMGR
ncbi:MAG: PKD domain-containing protein [Flavobacteriales bacterium]|nr:PKD domain-containing protein [Flavobacteriales bacterium]MBP7408906.1 PKD domain-containing protein [Flavobacteriales bacterium]